MLARYPGNGHRAPLSIYLGHETDGSSQREEQVRWRGGMDGHGFFWEMRQGVEGRRKQILGENRCILRISGKLEKYY